MPRSARLDAQGVLHHVRGRGIEKKKIFLRDEDRDGFVSPLAELGKKQALKIYAWAQLPNHLRLLGTLYSFELTKSGDSEKSVGTESVSLDGAFRFGREKEKGLAGH